jgi:predicted aminopeptidase
MKHLAKTCSATGGFRPGIFAPILIVAFVFYSTGCATSLYLVELGRGQARIIFHSRPNESVLQDPAIDESVKEKIRLVNQAKAYGEEEIGLAKTSNFTRFYQVQGPSLIYVLSASPEDRLESYEWWFPITGRVTAKGFFDRKNADREGEKLEKKGLDVFVQGAQAYSTLGWFKDPIFSTTLSYDPAMIVNVVVHELTHNTVFFKDQLDFNEQVAYFVGGQGAIDFTGAKFGVGSPVQKRAIGLLEDGVLFSRFINGLFDELKDLYSRSLPSNVKLREREIVFLKTKKAFGILRKQLRTDLYLGFENVKLNNAAVLAFGRYVADIEQIQRVYELLGRDLRRTVRLFKEMERSGVKDPQNYLVKWLKEREG